MMLSFLSRGFFFCQENTHGNFKDLICPDPSFQRIDDECSSISKGSDGKTLLLKTNSRRDFLLPMLAALDFAIIPQKSVDPKTLKIIDYRNTSGPYYVTEDKGDGNIILKANENHFLYSPDMVREIHLVSTRRNGQNLALELFKNDEIDHITTIEGLKVEDEKVLRNIQSNFHHTIYINSRRVFITEKGLQRIPLKRRLAFAKSIQRSFHDFYDSTEGYRPSREFILPFGGGGLSDEEIAFLDQTMSSVEMDLSGEGIRVDVLNSYGKDTHIIKANMPHLTVKKGNGIPGFTSLADEDMPDYILSSTDSGFLDDIGFLSYSMSAGSFGLSREEGEKWLREYMNIDNKNERGKKVKELQLNALIEGRMIPLVTSPYIAVIRKPWTMNFPEIFANNQLWKIRKN